MLDHVGMNPGFSHYTLAPEIQSLGFDSIWVSEHIVFHGPVLEAMTVLSYYAAAAPRLQLGTAVYLMPLRHATITAKTAATLDYISGGRLILGIGVGGEYPKEFEACGVPVKQRGGRTDEAIVVAKKLWSGERVTFEGKYFQLNDVRLQPLPVQPGGPPIWVAGRSDAAIRRAALLGDGYLPYLFTPERYRTSLQKVRETAAQAGREPEAIAAAHYLQYYIANSKEEARRAAADFMTDNYKQDFHPLVDRFLALGTPADCAEFIQRFVDAGARKLILIPASYPQGVPDQVRRAGEELLPLLRPGARRG
ncbi:MAG: LLM class flavin-dependent oxidoreductase [Chloroflexota bacterium]|nr:LLM class flavin-dependent oxidoreductase [Dehalococcoidia bacterium]MDW8253054.1 LLM class flavin-dependent oxidoreductase [Chloroflexota bacterium]